MKPFQWGHFSEFIDAGVIDASQTSVISTGASEFAAKQLANDEGAGTLEYLYTPDLKVIVADCAFNTPKTYEIIDGDLVRFYFGLDVSIETSLDGANLSVMCSSPAGILKSPSGRQMIETIPGRRRQTFVTIGCRPQRLDALFGYGSGEYTRSLTAFANAIDVHQAVSFGPSLKAAVREMFTRRPYRELRGALVAAKAQELLALALDDMLKATEPFSATVRLTDSDLAAVHEARLILVARFGRQLPMRALGLKVGINRTKLFYGFKHVFGIGIAEFLNERRMEEGLRLLRQTDMPISEIAAELGYEHQCNFSTRFRAWYGSPPSAYRRNRATRA